VELNPIKDRLCKYLRARNPYGMAEGGENPWYLLDDANTIFWCIRSSGGAGPDGGLVGPGLCQAGRGCFARPEDQK
jgi:hypothetical protein